MQPPSQGESYSTVKGRNSYTVKVHQGSPTLEWRPSRERWDRKGGELASLEAEGRGIEAHQGDGVPEAELIKVGAAHRAG